MATNANARRTILIVDDERNIREGLTRAYSREYNIFAAESAAAALGILAKNHVDLVLSDVRMPGGMDGVALLKQVRRDYPGVVCILLTAYGDVTMAVEAMKDGAADFLTKPVNIDELEMKIAKALRSRDLETENQQLHRQLDSRFGLANIIGDSPAMEKVFDVIRQAAPSSATVLIQGPSGTGKELVAHALHTLSNRSKGPFVAVNCAALAPSLLESELFGHEKGAFTGALNRGKGRFELADGGTLFLDEISEIEPSVQVKLLRVLETRTFERVGGTDPVSVDIRIVASTNRDLRAYVAEGKFREDLYYRLNVVSIVLPPLRDRREDIPALCSHFLKQFAEQEGKGIKGFTPEAIAALQGYSWPGNVRELRNAVNSMVLLAQGDSITAADIPAGIADDASGHAAKNADSRKNEIQAQDESEGRLRIFPAPRFTEPGGRGDRVNPGGDHGSTSPIPNGIFGNASLDDIERARTMEVLSANGGNRSKAADTLGISRRTLQRRLKAWGLQ